MTYLKVPEAIEHIEREWANNPLHLSQDADKTFCTMDGIMKQINTLFDNKGTIYFFVKKGENVELVPLKVNAEIEGREFSL